jgi:hypothetical protein
MTCQQRLNTCPVGGEYAFRHRRTTAGYRHGQEFRTSDSAVITFKRISLRVYDRLYKLDADRELFADHPGAWQLVNDLPHPGIECVAHPVTEEIKAEYRECEE